MTGSLFGANAIRNCAGKDGERGASWARERRHVEASRGGRGEGKAATSGEHRDAFAHGTKPEKSLKTGGPCG